MIIHFVKKDKHCCKKSAYKRRSFLTVVLCVALMSMFALALSACGATDIATSSPTAPSPTTPSGTPDPAPDTSDTTVEESPPPLAAFPPFQIPVSVASGINVEENESAIIDFSNASEGYVMAKFLQETSNDIRVIVEAPNGTQYVYTLKQGEFEVFAFTEGDGAYTVGIFEQVEDSRFRVVLNTHVDVQLSDPLLPFLRPNQFVNFNENSNVVRVANELVTGAGSFLDKISAVFNFIIENIEYDFDLAYSVQFGYVPNVDEVLARGRGICFDYAAVMAAMLRSQGIPTKMVFGYTGEVYHAWIHVYSEEEGWINNIIFFDGLDWVLMDPTFAAAGDDEAAAAFIGEGIDYVSMFYY